MEKMAKQLTVRINGSMIPYHLCRINKGTDTCGQTCGRNLNGKKAEWAEEIEGKGRL